MIPPALLSTYVNDDFTDIRTSFAMINANAAVFSAGVDYEICYGQSKCSSSRFTI